MLLLLLVLAFIMFCAKNFIHFACFNEKSEFFEIFMTVSEIFVRNLSGIKKSRPKIDRPTFFASNVTLHVTCDVIGIAQRLYQYFALCQN